MLYDHLKEYTSGTFYPMHMPGHKRNPGFLPEFPTDIDITEIDGFDDLHQPRSVLRETSSLAAKLYGSDEAFLMVNGSTAGILAAIGASTCRGDKILIARNCHISVYNAVALFGLIPVYIIPDTDAATGIACSISPAAVETALTVNRDVKLVVVTSPTYEGVVSDVAAIAEAAHKFDIPLIVDSAHGAHFGFSARFPESAVKLNADIVVISLHKTLPALTQCALLHVNGSRVDASEVKRLLSVFQTSSPSYVLLSSIDKCLHMLETNSAALFRDYEQNLFSFYSKAAQLRNLTLLWGQSENSAGFFASDPGKIVIYTGKTAMTGSALTAVLRTEYRIEMEMAASNYALAMTSVCDTGEGFHRLADALLEADGWLDGRAYHTFAPYTRHPRRQDTRLLVSQLPVQAVPPSEALALKGEFAALTDSVGLMSLEHIWAYPPGVPLVAPGEIIDDYVVACITELQSTGVPLRSTKGKLPDFIYAIAPPERGTKIGAKNSFSPAKQSVPYAALT